MPHFQAVLANLIWGSIPLYYYYFLGINPAFLLSIQIISSAVLLALFVKPDREHKQRAIWHYSNIVPAIILVLSWAVHVLAVQSGYALEASYAFLMMPVLFLLADVIVTRNPLQGICVLTALAAIVLDSAANRVIPIVGLAIALLFVGYVFWHRKAQSSPLQSLRSEMILMLPVGLAVFAVFVGEDVSYLQLSLLPFLGAFTVVPLLLFVKASKQVNFSALSLYQFISPVLGSYIAVSLYNQDFSTGKLALYLAIIAAIVISNIVVLRTSPTDPLIN
jgi:chloramphenicol-sensitive protein RarD